MALALDVLRTSRLYLLLLVLHVGVCLCGDISVIGEECDIQCRCKVLVPAGSSWRLTPESLSFGSRCTQFAHDYDIREQPETRRADGKVEISVLVPLHAGKLYFCRYDSEGSPVEGKWVHQGTSVALSGKENSLESSQLTKNNEVDRKADAKNAPSVKDSEESLGQNSINQEAWVDLSHDIDVNKPGAPRPTREEANDILVQSEGANQYVPLSEVNSHFNLKDQSNKNFESNDYSVDEFIILPDVNLDVKKVKELGASDRDVEPFEEDNTVVDMIETVQLRKKRSATEHADLNTVENNSTNDAAVASDKAVNNLTDDHSDEPKITAEHLKSDLGDSVRSDNVITDTVRIFGIRIEKSTKPPENENGIPSVLSLTPTTIRVFGVHFTNDTYIAFTNEKGKPGEPCPHRLKGEYVIDKESVEPESALFEIIAPNPITGDSFYFCTTNAPGGVTLDSKFTHQGTRDSVTLKSHNKQLPLWATLLLILVCLMFSSLFSGLNLGLMSLDRTELKIIANTGTERERKYSRQIQPVRDHGNYLLCSILLGNVAVNSTFTILLDDLVSGLYAVIFSTLAIVCLGEIVPQAICSRHGLMISAKTIVIMKCVMGITAPLAYPISKLLDYFLGEEIGSVYNRERLKELIKVTNDMNDLDKDEVNIISGALEMRKKTVAEVMTKIEDVYMLSSDSVLDFETMSEIVKSGFSRIPVYEGLRSNIITVLFIKDLAFVDPDDNTPLKTLCQFYQNVCNFVFEDTTLDVMFRQFKEGHKGHMAFVHRVNNQGEGDPFYETVGLVTLEDVIEEMIQAEIVDETDVFMDNRSKRRRYRPQDKLTDFAAFAERREHHHIRISPQLTLATFQFLASSVDAFRPDAVSETVLRRLLRQDIVHQIKCKGKDKSDPSTLVYTQGKPVDYFVLILEGRVEVTVGRENLVFEAGPFTYFGVQALTQNVGVAESPTPSMMGSLQNINMDAMLRYTFVPDYSVRAVTELLYIVIKRSLYLAAKRATLMEKTSTLTKGGGSAGEQFDNEVDKLLQSLDEDVSVSGDNKTPTRQVSPSQPPASANPVTRSSFAPAAGSPSRGGNGDVTYKFPPSQQIEQEDKPGDK